MCRTGKNMQNQIYHTNHQLIRLKYDLNVFRNKLLFKLITKNMQMHIIPGPKLIIKKK